MILRKHIVMLLDTMKALRQTLQYSALKGAAGGEYVWQLFRTIESSILIAVVSIADEVSIPHTYSSV